MGVPVKKPLNTTHEDTDEPTVPRCEVPSKTLAKAHVADAKAPRQERVWSL